MYIIMSEVKVGDMKIGNTYIVDGCDMILTDTVKEGTHDVVYFNLTFTTTRKYVDWQTRYKEKTAGGKRKTRRQRKSKVNRR
jgi:hypothetical protein